MPEEDRAVPEQEEFKLRSCKHKNCKYRAASKNAYGVYNCDYALVTGPPARRSTPQTSVSLQTVCCTSRAPERSHGVSHSHRQDEQQEKGCVPAAVHKPLPQALPELHP